MLVRPEYIDQVNPKFKKKVEGIARKPVKQDDDPEPLSPCPHCSFKIPETELNCPNCKNNIPFCIASGKHMIISEWSHCPACKMCGIYSELKRVLENEASCPMCESNVHPMMVKLSDDALGDFKALVNLMKDPSGADEEEAGMSEDDQALQD